MLLLDRLPGDTKYASDVLPGPALLSGAAHMEVLETLEEMAKSNDGAQALFGVIA